MAEGEGRTLADSRRETRAQLRAAGIAEADLDARRLVQAASGLDAAGLILREREPLGAARGAVLSGYVARRLSGEPVHRILGVRAFRDHAFALSPETLEPRPDTEILVDFAAEALRHGGRDDPVFADLGTGSGAIAVSLLAMFPAATCLAVDLSPGALLTARRNAEAAGVGARFLPVCADYLAGVGPGLDAVVSNPPYIPSAGIEALAREVREHDPRLALDGGPDGLDAYRAIAAGLTAGPHAPDVVCEIGAGQEVDVSEIFRTAGYRLRSSKRDLGGHVRALWFRSKCAETGA